MHDKKIRWGVIGAGDVFEHKSGAALYQTADSELVALVRTNAARAAEAAQRHAARRWYTDAQSLVNDPEVNAVYIASPHYLHLEHVTLAARAGKSVLCEKPLGVNTMQARASVAVCRQHGVSLTVAYYRRFWKVTRLMHEYLSEGAIGQVVAARAQVTDLFSRTDPRAWLYSRAQSGGDALANVGAHWVDLFRHLLGEVTDVMAYCSHLGGGARDAHGLGDETDDTVLTEMRMENGALASLIVTRRTPIITNEIDIFGTAGRLVASPLSEGHLILHRRGRDPEVMQFPRHGVMHSELIAELVPRLLRGEPSPVPGEEALAAWRVMEAAYRSAEEGVRVAVASQ